MKLRKHLFIVTLGGRSLWMIVLEAPVGMAHRAA